MKIVICGSMSAAKQMQNMKQKLEEKGHSVITPEHSELHATGAFGPETSGEATERKIEDNLIQKYFWEIQDCDCVIVANYDKGEKKNYIGGNSFLEAGFAHVLGKKLYFLNDIPDYVSYYDELVAFQPVILHGDIDQI